MNLHGERQLSSWLTWSGRGFLGPLLPVGSWGSIIFTLMPRTPTKRWHCIGGQDKCTVTVSSLSDSTTSLIWRTVPWNKDSFSYTTQVFQYMYQIRGLSHNNRPAHESIIYLPCLKWTWVIALSMYSLMGLPAWIMRPSTNFIDLALCPRSFPDTTTSQPLAPLSMIKRRTP